MILILIFAEALALYGLIGASLLKMLSDLVAVKPGRSKSESARCLEAMLPIPAYCLTQILGVVAVGIILASKAGTATPGQ